MKILKVNEWCQYLTEMAAIRTTAKQIDDFFEMLDAEKLYTQAHVYYAKSMDGDLAKTTNGKRMPNPMLGRFFKTIHYKFQFGKEYQTEQKRKNPGIELNPNAPMNQENRKPSGLYPVDGYKYIRQNKFGELVFPIIDYTVIKTNYYMIDDDGNIVECDRDTVVPYMIPSKAYPKPSKPSPYGFVEVKQNSLHVDRIYMLNANKKTWKNVNGFQFPILAPFFKK